MSNQYKLKVLGGRHYPLPGTLLVLANGKKADHVVKGDVFISDVDLRKALPNRFELVQEIERSAPAEATEAPANSGKAEVSDFPAADRAGLTVEEKKIKGKGTRYFLFDHEVSETEPLNKKSLGKDEVDEFVAEYVKGKK
jgi:hypothetical protein